MQGFSSHSGIVSSESICCRALPEYVRKWLLKTAMNFLETINYKPPTRKIGISSQIFESLVDFMDGIRTLRTFEQLPLFSLSRFFYLQGQKHYWQVHFDRHCCNSYMSCNYSFWISAYMCVCAVIKVSLVLLEHLHYIMEKGNPVVYLSACNVAQGVDQGSW